MPDIDISTAGVAKLLSNLNVSKAADLDSVNPIVLKELCQVIAPVITIIYQISVDSGTVPSDWKKDKVCLRFKNVIRQIQQTTARYH